MLTNRGFRRKSDEGCVLSLFPLFIGSEEADRPSARARARASVIEITDRCHTVERAFELFIGTVLLRADLL